MTTNTTAIGWTDSTWNPTRGCRRISPGCTHCYAEVQADRIVRMGKGAPTAYDGLVHRVGGEPRWTGLSRFVDDKLAAPLQWRKPRRIFVDSMSDLFYEGFSDEEIAVVFGVMLLAGQHTYQVLTKRSARMRRWFGDWSVESCIEAAARYTAPDGMALPGTKPHNFPPAAWRDVEAWPVPWIWMGVSVENREHGLPRIDDLRGVPATTRFLSCEPLLEDLGELDLTGIGWVIDGCESGDEPRPAEPEWFNRIANQCRDRRVPYFHKQEFVAGRLRHDVGHFSSPRNRQEFP